MRDTFDICVPNAPMGHSMEHSMGGHKRSHSNRGTFDIGVPNAPMGHSMGHSMGHKLIYLLTFKY